MCSCVDDSMLHLRMSACVHASERFLSVGVCGGKSGLGYMAGPSCGSQLVNARFRLMWSASQHEGRLVTTKQQYEANSVYYFDNNSQRLTPIFQER